MTRWLRGKDYIDQMIADRELQQIRGDATEGTGWLEKAATTLASAGELLDADPNSAYVLAYDAARFACAGLLAQQGLRATTIGGHYAIQQAMLHQFGPTFASFGVIRRRRNELEYPQFPDEIVEKAEAGQAIATAQSLLEAANKLVGHLGIY